MAKTLAQILAGEDMEGGEVFCDSVYNYLKNHWYGPAAPASPVNGMIWIKDDGTNWVYTGGAWVGLGIGGGGVNLILNSGFGVCSQSSFENVSNQITVTDITNGICTTGNTEDLQVGDLVLFAGDAAVNGNVYEVTAVVVDTTFTIHDLTVNPGAVAATTCFEKTPGFVAADVYAPDTWTKTDTLDLYRWFNHTTYHKGMYGLKVIKGVDGPEYLNAFGNIFDKDHHYLRFRGREVTFGCWVYSVAAADNVKVQINDSVGTTESAFVVANTLTWVEVKRTCGAGITSFTPRILFDGDTADVAYISRPMLVFGSSIGDGNYQPRQQENILLDAFISSTLLNGLLNQATTAVATLNLEADSYGKLPKGAKSLLVFVKINDAGSVGANAHFYCRADAAQGTGLDVSVWGLTNDAANYTTGPVKCNEDGDFDWRIIATGGASFDLSLFRYIGVQVN